MRQQQLLNCYGMAVAVSVLVAQPVRAEVTQVTAVLLNPTASGIEVILETQNGKLLQVLTRSEGDVLIADIPNTQLAIPEGRIFRSDDLPENIAGVTVTQLAQLVLGGHAEAKPVPTQTPIAISQLLQQADATLPGGKISYAELPEDQPNKIIFHKKFPEQKTGEFDLSVVEIDHFTGKVLSAQKVLEPNPVFKFLLMIVDLHYGTFGGLLTRILYVFIGLMSTILLITGLVMWKRRRWLKDRRKAAVLVITQAQENITK